MSAPQPTRAELYARIQASSRDAVVLAEMQRLGFWPADNGQPQVAPDLIQREAELNQQLHALYQESAKYGNPEKALRMMRRERMAAARDKREQTRRKHNEAQYARAQAWHAQRDQHMGWLGEGVMAGVPAPTRNTPCLDALADPEVLRAFISESRARLAGMSALLTQWRSRPQAADAPQALQASLRTLTGSARMAGAARLAELSAALDAQLNALEASAQTEATVDAFKPALQRLRDALTQTAAQHTLDLPALDDAPALAAAMGIGVPELRFLATHREVSRSTHYQRFTVPKKTGGQRQISAPMPRLKRAQYWVLDNILAKLPVHAAAHGFLPGHSIVSNATPHTGQDVVINLDLQDFFPSIGFARIKGVFAHQGYGDAVATVLALLCSEARADTLSIDGETVHIAGKLKERVLPQGAPTSPQLTNVLCRTLDRRLAALATKLGFAYTRYADDLSFSASGEAAQRVGELLRRVRFIVRQEGFTPHPTKQAVMRRGRQQSVTGLVVNGDAPSVSRAQRKRLRAALHRAQTQGLQHAHWHGQPMTRAQLIGWAQFVHQVQAPQGRALLNQALTILPPNASAQTVNALATQASQRDTARLRFRQAAAQGQVPALASGTWWQPAAQAAPTLALTDQQRREQRKARSQARREATSPAAAPVASPALEATTSSTTSHQAASDPRLSSAPGNAQHEAPQDAPEQSLTGPRPRKFVTYLLQLIAAWSLGNLVLQDRRFTMAAFALLVFLYLIRKQSWALWGVAMGVAWLVAYSLRFLG